MTDQDENTKEALTARGSARRAAVLKAAASLFLEQGYERTSLTQIIERAGGSKTTLYAQFGHKAGLFNTVVIELCEAAFGPPDEGFSVEGNTSDVLTHIARNFLRMLWGDDVLALSRIVYTEGGRNPEIADVFFDTGYEEGYRQLAGYLCGVTPDLQHDDAMRLGRMFLTMLPGDAYDRLLAGASVQRTQAELDDQIAMSVEWLVWQLSKKSP